MCEDSALPATQLTHVIRLSCALQFQDSETKRLIEKKEYDSPGRFTGRVGNTGGGQGVSMETLSRFSMIKSRIY